MAVGILILDIEVLMNEIEGRTAGLQLLVKSVWLSSRFLSAIFFLSLLCHPPNNLYSIKLHSMDALSERRVDIK